MLRRVAGPVRGSHCRDLTAISCVFRTPCDKRRIVGVAHAAIVVTGASPRVGAPSGLVPTTASHQDAAPFLGRQTS